MCFKGLYYAAAVALEDCGSKHFSNEEHWAYKFLFSLQITWGIEKLTLAMMVMTA